jgi:hypothetical protein
MDLIQRLKTLAGMRKDDVEGAKLALDKVEADLSVAYADFSAAEEEFGARLVEAIPKGHEGSVHADRDAKRRKVEELRAARAAIAMRLQAAQEAASAAELGKRWDAAEKALRAHRLALVRFERAAKDLAAAMLAAEAAALTAYESLPERHGAQPFLTDLTGELQRQIALATEGKRGGYVGSFLHDLKGQPPLIQRAEAVAAQWLSRRPPASDENPPEAA